jgi:hypothetical protein
MRLTVTWEGNDYRVKEDQAFELMEAIERHITLPELMLMIGGGRPNFSALARPLHVMLEHVGVRNVPSLLDLRRMLVAEGMASLKAQSEGRETVAGMAMAAITALVMILMDGAPEIEADDGKKTAPHSSSPATKSRSGNGASRRKTSGK